MTQEVGRLVDDARPSCSFEVTHCGGVKKASVSTR